MSVKDELRKKMQGFANMANFCLSRAAYILSIEKIIKSSPSKLNQKIPPDNDFIKKIYETEMIESWISFEGKTEYYKNVVNFFINGIDEILKLELKNSNSFRKMVNFYFCMAGLSLMLAKSDELEKLCHYIQYGNGDVETFETIKKKVANNKFIVAFEKTKEIQILLDTKFKQMEGYWAAKYDSKKAGQKAASAKTEKMRERVQELREMVEQAGKWTNDNLEVDRYKWEEYFNKIFRYPYVSSKTKRTYKAEIEKLLTSKFKKEIKIIFKK